MRHVKQKKWITVTFYVKFLFLLLLILCFFLLFTVGYRPSQRFVSFKKCVSFSIIMKYPTLSVMWSDYIYIVLLALTLAGTVQQRQIWGRKATKFCWATFGWASCIIDNFVTLVKHWTLLSSLSYNQAYVRGPRFGSTTSLAHQAHVALISIVKQGSSLGTCPTFLYPKSPL